MKKILALSFLFVGITMLSAQSASDVFKSESITWYGLDFSKVKLIGPDGFKNPQEIKEVSFISMNDVIVTEKKKFDLGKFFRKSSVAVNLDVVKKNNEKIIADELVTADIKFNKFIDQSMVEELIKNYDCGSDSGLGLVFVMENLNKGESTASMLVTFFDSKTKEIILMKRMVGKAGGIGFRNYWVAAVFKVLKQIYDEDYDKWEKEHNQ